MKQDFDIHRDFWGPLLTLQLSSWRDLVYKPVQHLIDRNGYAMRESGVYPELRIKKRPTSPFLSKDLRLHTLHQLPAYYDTVKHFDLCAAEYDLATGPFRAAIWKEVVRAIRPLIAPHCQILDACCGTATEAICLSEIAPEGKVVAADLSIEMMTTAFGKAKQLGKTNMRFYQKDVLQLPASWKQQFDITYCQLSLSWLPSWEDALEQFYSVTTAGGLLILVEPCNTWYNRAASPLLKASNPAFQQIVDEQELKTRLISTGFSAIYQKEILPGICLFIASR